MKAYQYPDTHDVITNQYIKHHEPYPQYWQKSEDRILNRLIDHLRSLPEKGRQRFLDAGCGGGRLLPVFAPYFREIIALDPDNNRLNMAKDIINKNNLAEKTSLFNCKTEELKDQQNFDFILSSHILQHLPTNSVFPILEHLINLLNPNGLLAVTTCHSIAPHDVYTKSYLENGQLQEIAISKEEFNRCIDQMGILPAHFFESETFTKTINTLGMERLDFQVFHANIPDIHPLTDTDDLLNASPEMQAQHGRDMYLLFRKIN